MYLDPDEAARQLKVFIIRELLEIQRLSQKKLLKARYKKFRRMGEYSSYFRAAISREVSQLQDYLHKGVEELREHIPRRGKDSASPHDANNTLVP